MKPPIRLGLWPAVGLVAAACGLIMGGVVGLAATTDYTFGYFSRDPASTLGGSPVVGLLSYTGVLLAWTTAVACLLTATYVAGADGWRRVTPLLVAGAGLAFLALDDLFQIHEEIVPTYLGVPQEAVLGAYAVAALAYLWWFRDFLRLREWPLLAFALAVLAASVAMDQQGELIVRGSVQRFLEESFKLFGLALLATFLLRLGAQMHAAAYSPAPPKA